MRPNLPIAMLAGVAAGILLYLAMTGGVGALVLMLVLVPVPIALAGFSSNAATALAAAMIGLIGSAVVFRLPAVALYALAAFPIAGLVYLALLKRVHEDGHAEWYPVGRVVFAASIVAGALFAVAMMPLASDPDAYSKSVREAVELGIERSMAGLPPEAKLKPEQIEQLTTITGQVLPAAGGMLVLVILLSALWLGAQVARSAGTLVRPWPDIAALRFPPGAPLLLAASMIGSGFLTGPMQVVATSFSGAFFAAYVLLGLAVLHYVTRGAVWRTPVLVLIYVLLLLNLGLTPVIAMLGLADSIFPLRKGAGETAARDEPGPP